MHRGLPGDLEELSWLGFVFLADGVTFDGVPNERRKEVTVPRPSHPLTHEPLDGTKQTTQALHVTPGLFRKAHSCWIAGFCEGLAPALKRTKNLRWRIEENRGKAKHVELIHVRARG